MNAPLSHEVTRALLGCEPSCLKCKRVMLPGEVFTNGYGDGPSICHACKQLRNEQLTRELAEGAEEDEELCEDQTRYE